MRLLEILELLIVVAILSVGAKAFAQDAGTETAGTETAGTETAGTKAAGTKAAGTETAGTETAGTETAGTETAGTDSFQWPSCSDYTKEMKAFSRLVYGVNINDWEEYQRLATLYREYKSRCYEGHGNAAELDAELVKFDRQREKEKEMHCSTIHVTVDRCDWWNPICNDDIKVKAFLDDNHYTSRTEVIEYVSVKTSTAYLCQEYTTFLEVESKKVEVHEVDPFGASVIWFDFTINKFGEIKGDIPQTVSIKVLERR